MLTHVTPLRPPLPTTHSPYLLMLSLTYGQRLIACKMSIYLPIDPALREVVLAANAPSQSRKNSEFRTWRVERFAVCEAETLTS